MKKIKILTHRLGFNYGGIAQAYALQAVVKRIVGSDYDVSTGHLHPDTPLHIRIRSTLYRTIRGGKLYISAKSIDKSIMRHTNSFLEKYVSQSTFSSKDTNVSHYIVGSDQVWRASYVDPVKYMFGSVEDESARYFSYAASFGTDDLQDYTQGQIEQTAYLARKFSGLSVREDSGVDIVKRHWRLKAEFHIDPTLLIERRDYSTLVNQTETNDILAPLFVYVLDDSKECRGIVEKIAGSLGSDYFELLPKKYSSHINYIKHRNDYVMPKFEQWLRSFRDADFVVTDSFHGMVFSIIFNKPFIAIGNRGRGLARFTSLLKIFNLEDRLVSDESEVTFDLINAKINWNEVNEIKKKEQKRSLDYLKGHLGK